MSLKVRLSSGRILVAPGIFDGLTATLAAQAGFEALYLSGAAVAYTRLGRPDVGLTSLTEMVDTLLLIRDRVDLPVIVDADTGFGNALNAQRAMRLLERAGAAALQVEDQTYPKRCGHLEDKSIIPAEEMAGKIAAMAEARRDSQTLIIARTDAVAVEGFEAAIARARLYREAGAEVIFVEAPRSGEELAAVPAALPGVPLVANMVEGGTTPVRDAGGLEAMGYALVIFPGGVVRAIAKTAEAYYSSLKAHGTNAPFAERMLDFRSLNDRLGTDDLLAEGARYGSMPRKTPQSG